MANWLKVFIGIMVVIVLAWIIAFVVGRGSVKERSETAMEAAAGTAAVTFGCVMQLLGLGLTVLIGYGVLKFLGIVP